LIGIGHKLFCEKKIAIIDALIDERFTIVESKPGAGLFSISDFCVGDTWDKSKIPDFYFATMVVSMLFQEQ